MVKIRFNRKKKVYEIVRHLQSKHAQNSKVNTVFFCLQSFFFFSYLQLFSVSGFLHFVLSIQNGNLPTFNFFKFYFLLLCIDTICDLLCNPNLRFFLNSFFLCGHSTQHAATPVVEILSGPCGETKYKKKYKKTIRNNLKWFNGSDSYHERAC